MERAVSRSVGRDTLKLGMSIINGRDFNERDDENARGSSQGLLVTSAKTPDWARNRSWKRRWRLTEIIGVVKDANK
jgi:hypothetical protein